MGYGSSSYTLNNLVWKGWLHQIVDEISIDYSLVDDSSTEERNGMLQSRWLQLGLYQTPNLGCSIVITRGESEVQ